MSSNKTSNNLLFCSPTPGTISTAEDATDINNTTTNNNNNNTITNNTTTNNNKTAADVTTNTTSSDGNDKVSDNNNQLETPIIFDQRRWELQRRYLTNPFKYLGITPSHLTPSTLTLVFKNSSYQTNTTNPPILPHPFHPGYHVFDPLEYHPLNPVDKFFDFVDNLLLRALPDNVPIPTVWNSLISEMKCYFTQSYNHNHDWLDTRYVKILKAQLDESKTLTSRSSGGCGTVVVVEPLEGKPGPHHVPSSPPFPWKVKDFSEWAEMIVGKITMQVSDCPHSFPTRHS